jgi:Flp pilus assembly protein protease CpaA
MWPMAQSILLLIVILCLGVAAVTDIADRIIPNRLVLIILGCCAAVRLLSEAGSLAVSVLLGVIVLFVLGGLAAYDFVGWGDVKLIAAVTFAVPASQVAELLLAITISGGGLACLYLIIRTGLRRGVVPVAAGETGIFGAIRGLAFREGARIRANEPMPYAVAVLSGVAYGLAAF